MKLSVIVLVYNEAESIVELYEELSKVLKSEFSTDWEILFVNDGSSDSSESILEHVATTDSQHVRVVSLARNYGQTVALAAGIDYSRGDIIVSMDADLQNDPADIHLLIQKIEEGYDLVNGWRQKRKDSFLTRKMPSKIANWLISKMVGVSLKDYGCTLKAYRKSIIAALPMYAEMHRLIPAYAVLFGAKVFEVPVRNRKRKYGKSKYGLNRVFKIILDLMTYKFISRCLNKPMRLFGSIGAVIAGTSSVILCTVWLGRFTASGIAPLWVILLELGMLILIGIQIMLLGLVVELVMWVYRQSSNKRFYQVRRFILPADFKKK